MAPKKTALIYDRIVAVSSKRHGRTSVEVGKDFRFAAKIDAVPVLAEEFASLARFCPIVFAGPEDAPLPHAMLGMKRGHNVFIGPKGGWAAPYIPAFLRRYPFISAPMGPEGAHVLAMDQAFAGVNVTGKGHALYTEAGEPTKFLKDVTTFVGNFDASLEATRAFVARLMDHNLLEQMSIRVTDADGETTGAIGGMYGISQARLDALDADARDSLAEKGDIARCKLHIRSMSHIRRKPRNVTPRVPTRPH